jgi:hypothetical protein
MLLSSRDTGSDVWSELAFPPGASGLAPKTTFMIDRNLPPLREAERHVFPITKHPMPGIGEEVL